MVDKTHSTESKLRESVIEHLFLGELTRTLWCQGKRDIEILRSEVDNSGYDVVVGCNGIMRYIQLKSSYAGAKTSRIGVNLRLKNKPDGCVIWLWFNEKTMDFEKLLWFGGTPGKTMPDLGNKIARHSKGDQSGHKAERPNQRVINKGRFATFTSMEEVAKELFG